MRLEGGLRSVQSETEDRDYKTNHSNDLSRIDGIGPRGDMCDYVVYHRRP
jgi:hypothetical protein